MVNTKYFVPEKDPFIFKLILNCDQLIFQSHCYFSYLFLVTISTYLKKGPLWNQRVMMVNIYINFKKCSNMYCSFIMHSHGEKSFGNKRCHTTRAKNRQGNVYFQSDLQQTEI